MPIASSNSEIEQAAVSCVDTMIKSMPYDAQDPSDVAFAEHYALDMLASKVNSRLRKMDERVKEGVRNGITELVTTSKNYQRNCRLNSPRTMFDKDAFIDLVHEAYPDIPKHKLRELADKPDAYKLSAAPVSIEFEYKGDL